MKTIKKTLLLAVVALSQFAHADPIVVDETYTLGNHPDGGAAEPFYGLRLDGLVSGNPNHIYTFDFENQGAFMQMLWDGAASTIRIWGDAFGGQDIGSGYGAGTTDLWAIDFLYTNVYGCGTGQVCSNTGSGSISSSIFGSFNLTPTGSDTHGYTFRVADGHRGVPDLSGWGWMNHCRETFGSGGNTGTGGSCNRHLYHSDWLFTATSVPEPGTLALFSIGILGLGIARRRKRV